MMEKLSSLWVRFMPTLVSPATSMRSGPPTTADRRKDALTVSTTATRNLTPRSSECRRGSTRGCRRVRAPRGARPGPRGTCRPPKTRSFTVSPGACLPMASASFSGESTGCPSTATMMSAVGFSPAFSAGLCGRDRRQRGRRASVPASRPRPGCPSHGRRRHGRRRASSTRNERMAVTGAPSTTGLQARLRRRLGALPQAAHGDIDRLICAAPLHARTSTPTTLPVASSSGAPGDRRALEVDVEHLQERLPVAGMRVDAPLHGGRRRDRGAPPWPGSIARTGDRCRVGLARAQPIRPLARDCGTSSARSESLSACPTLA